jgi:Uma2 family endonuclease
MLMDMNPGEVAQEVSEVIRPLRRVEFDQLARAGCFDDERVELLYGAIVEMSPPDPSHDESIGVLMELLVGQLRGRARVRGQSAFAASEYSEPLPDIVVAPAGRYWAEHPSHALLVIEVSRSSLRIDRKVKSRLYASCRVDEYWIVDLVNGAVEVYRQPLDNGWGDMTIHQRGAILSPTAWHDVVIPIDEILPPA